MRNLNHQLKELSRRNRDGCHAAQRDRERILSLIADQLHALGFRGMSARSLKPKHVEALLGQWQREELSVGTIKNRLAAEERIEDRKSNRTGGCRRPDATIAGRRVASAAREPTGGGTGMR